MHVPAVSRIEARISHTADWDVSVSFDSETCEVFCEYRRKEGGLHLFLAPVTEVLVYTDGPASPQLVIVDPAGMRQPAASSRAGLTVDLSCTEGKGLPIGVLSENSERSAPPTVSLATIPAASAIAPALGLSLRI